MMYPFVVVQSGKISHREHRVHRASGLSRDRRLIAQLAEPENIAKTISYRKY
jgi:hypothetical protein